MNILMEQVTIAVTQDDILDGVRQDPSRCPVARAICRAVPGADTVRVYGPNATWWVDGRAFDVYLPEHVGAWIGEFDMNTNEAFGGVTPITFTVSLNEVPV